MKKLTTEVFKERMLKQFGEDFILTSEYVGAKVSVAFKCAKCGHEGHGWPDSLYKQKFFCRDCMNMSKRKTHENHLVEVTNTEVLCIGTYTNAKTKVQYQCTKCSNVWETLPYNIRRGSGCPHCAAGIVSKLEKWLRSQVPEAVYNNRELLGIELDIYYPDKHLAVEVSGAYWHRDTEKGKDYHFNKYEKCASKGIKLLQIWDFELEKKQDIVLSRIRNALGLSTRINARECKLVELDINTARNFLESNHIQGYANSSIRVGLEYYGELVSVMTFTKPRFSTEYDWELLRYASLIDISVIGGASRLLKFAKQHGVTGAVVSYCDLRYGTGELYEKLGFDLSHISPPNYFYKKNTKILTRYQCQKHKLAELLPIFDDTKSEYENMLDNGYYRVHDAGNKVYELVI